jgi:hypothetical protein
MTLPQTAADRRRYLEGGLVDLACDYCAGLVRVRKNSPDQTSVQWTVAAAQGCAEFAPRRGAGGTTAHLPTCERLRASIGRAVAEGRVTWAPADGSPVEPAPRGTPTQRTRVDGQARDTVEMVP